MAIKKYLSTLALVSSVPNFSDNDEFMAAKKFRHNLCLKPKYKGKKCKSCLSFEKLIYSSSCNIKGGNVDPWANACPDYIPRKKR